MLGGVYVGLFTNLDDFLRVFLASKLHAILMINKLTGENGKIGKNPI